MSRAEEEARAREYRRSTQARYDYYLLLENATQGSALAELELHEDYDPLLPDAGWNPVERTFVREEDVK